MSSGLRLVIFDVDGTLIDSQAEIKMAMEMAFGALNHPTPPPEAVLGIVGLSLPEAMRQLAPDLDDAVRDKIVTAYKDAFHVVRQAHAPAPLYPGARAVLEQLATRDDTLMGVATGKSRRGLDHVLASHDLAQFFVTAQVADHHPSKPHPSMIHAALGETGVQSSDAVMIGDTSFDMAMGRAAGVHTVGVAWGYHGAGRLHEADHLITDFTALPDVLAHIWSD